LDQLVKNVIPSKFYGLIPKTDSEGIIYYKNKNFTSKNWYSNTYMMSHYPAYWFFLTIGSRGRGKTFSGKRKAIKYIIEQIENGVPNGQLRKFMWWRLTTDAIVKVIQNNGATFFEKKLLTKHQISVKISNNDIFFARWCDDTEDDNGEITSKWYHVGKAAAIQEYFKFKGNQFEEYDLIIMDELVRAASERRTFNIPSAFINMVENVARTRKGICIMIYANAIGEMHEVKQLFGFMPFPGKFGVYKLPHKKAIIEYLDDSKAWKQSQEDTYAGVLRGAATEFTNVHIDPLADQETFFIQRKHTSGKRYFASIKLSLGMWVDIHTIAGKYYIDSDYYTSDKMKKQNRYCIDRSLATPNTIYSKEMVKAIQELWSSGKLRFSNSFYYKEFIEACKRFSVI